MNPFLISKQQCIESDFNLFDKITIDETLPRIYFHKNNQYMFNSKAFDMYDLVKNPMIMITDFHRKRYMAVINVDLQKNEDGVMAAKMSAHIDDYPKNAQNLYEEFFSYELLPLMDNRFDFTYHGKALTGLRTRKLQAENLKLSVIFNTQQEAKNNRNKERWCKLLGITQDKYNELLFEWGIYYIEHNYLPDTLNRDAETTSNFWRWWQKDYFLVDNELLKQYSFEMDVNNSIGQLLKGKTLIEWYEYEHTHDLCFPANKLIFKSDHKH